MAPISFLPRYILRILAAFLAAWLALSPSAAGWAENQSYLPSRKVSGPLPTGWKLDYNYAVDPTGKNVIYIAENNTTPSLNDDVLYTAPTAGGTYRALHDPYTTDNFANFKISPDGKRVAFTAPLGGTSPALYIEPITGASPKKLSKVNHTVYANYVFTPDSQWLFYASYDALDHMRLYRVPVDGPPEDAIDLTPPLAQCAEFAVSSELKLSPDGHWIVFVGACAGTADYGVFSMPDGGPVSNLSKLTPDMANPYLINFAISSDSNWVAARIPESGSTASIYSCPITRAVFSLYRCFHRVSGQGAYATAFAFTPDNSRLVYVSDEGTTGQPELFSVNFRSRISFPPDPPAVPTHLNVPLPPGGKVDPYSFLITPDSQRVVYAATQVVDRAQVFSVPTEGPDTENITLSPEPLAYLTSITMKLSHTGSHVFYLSHQESADLSDLYSVPVTGPAGAATRLNLPLKNTPGSVVDYWIAPDDRTVLYSADCDLSTRRDLYAVPYNGPATASIKLNSNTRATGYVNNAVFIPGSHEVVYAADEDFTNVTELFAVRYADDMAFLPLVRR